MELSERFKATLTDEQKAILEEEEAVDTKKELEKYLAERAEGEKRQEEAAEALKKILV